MLQNDKMKIYSSITETIGNTPIGKLNKRILVIVSSCSECYLSTWLFADVNTESDELVIENGVLKA